MASDFTTQSRRFAVSTGLSLLAACSSASAPSTSLSLASTYHLRIIDGASVPFSVVEGGAVVVTTDSGLVRRLGGDTISIEEYSHSQGSVGPGLVTIARGTWWASQSGNVVVLHPIIASSLDTAFVGRGDTLTLHINSQVQVYVSP